MVAVDEEAAVLNESPAIVEGTWRRLFEVDMREDAADFSTKILEAGLFDFLFYIFLFLSNSIMQQSYEVELAKYLIICRAERVGRRNWRAGRAG